MYSMCLATTLYKVLDEAYYIKMWYRTHLVITAFEHRSFIPLSRWEVTHVKSYTRQVSCYSLYLNDCVVDGLKSSTKDKLLDQSGSKIIYPQVYGTE